MQLTPLKFEDLTIEQKVGLVITGRLVGRDDDLQFALELIKNHALGAVQMFPSERNMERYMKPILAAADYPILVGVDMERGCQLDDLIIPGNLALGALNDKNAVYTFARATATLAKKHGYNMIWSPVVDCAEYDRPCIISRCFGSDRNDITDWAEQYLKAFADCGVVGSVKHYPSVDAGHLDTHMAEEICTTKKEEIIERNLAVYKNLIDRMGDDMMGIMVGHTRCIDIDPIHPATLSKPTIDIIKNMGFKGLTITDSMAMVGMIQKYGDKTMHGMALAAGNDLILGNYRLGLRDTYKYMLQNFKDGVFSLERLDDAVKKVLAAQERTLKQPDRPITEADRQIIMDISKNCICDIYDDGVVPALDKDKKHLFVIDTENKYPDGDNFVEGEIETIDWWRPKKIAERLKAEYPDSTVQFVCEFPSRKQVEDVCVGSANHDDVVYITFCDSECYQGTDGLTERLRVLIESTAVKNAAVVHFGNPYALERLVHIKRLVVGFPSERCIDYTLDVLTGKMKAVGKMPIKLNLK